MIHSLNQHERVAELWQEAEIRLLQSAPEEQAEIYDGFVRRAVEVLERPEFGGYVATDLSDLTRHSEDRQRRQYIKKAFKRLHKRGETVKVAPVGEGMVFRLV